jgi:hypothetical protein
MPGIKEEIGQIAADLLSYEKEKQKMILGS